jgi:hypothetical protein
MRHKLQAVTTEIRRPSLRCNKKGRDYGNYVTTGARAA